MQLRITLKTISYISSKHLFNQKPLKKCLLFLDKDFSYFCLKLSQHFGRPIRWNKCLYCAECSDKHWHDTLDTFFVNKFDFKSRFDGYLFIFKNGNDWIKLINYVHDSTLYFDNNNNVRQSFELSLKNEFNMSLCWNNSWSDLDIQTVSFLVLVRNGFVVITFCNYSIWISNSLFRKLQTLKFGKFCSEKHLFIGIHTYNNYVKIAF